MSFLVGLSKSEITCFIPNIGMMGYGRFDNIVKEVATPLWARAMIIEAQDNKKFILVHLELAFTSIAIKEEVLNLLKLKYPEWKLTHADLLITANHTHAAPGGFSHYPFYNFSIPKFNHQIFNTIIKGIIEAIEKARGQMESCSLEWGEKVISEDKEVAFNRSMKPFLNNTDAPKLKLEDSALAIDRCMKGLRIFDQSGKLKGLVNWFAVHCTSISGHNHKIHHDNKGVAASLFEKNHPGSIAIFAQTHAGDVTPNFKWDSKLKRMGGKFQDQYQDVEFNGEIQFREAEKISTLFKVDSIIESYHSYFDISKKASTAAHGVSFLQGTLEGPGIASYLTNTMKIASRIVRAYRLINDPKTHTHFYNEQSQKDVVFDHRNGTALGLSLNFWKKVKYIPDPVLESFRKDACNEALNTLQWVPHVIPFQLTRIGEILIASVPGEMTTTAGKRLKEHLAQGLKDFEFSNIVIAGYSNGYMGYVTTPEEYALQHYEGGHTMYGKNTLQAIMTCFDELIIQMKEQNSSRSNNIPFKFPQDELDRRSVQA